MKSLLAGPAAETDNLFEYVPRFIRLQGPFSDILSSGSSWRGQCRGVAEGGYSIILSALDYSVDSAMSCRAVSRPSHRIAGSCCHGKVCSPSFSSPLIRSRGMKKDCVTVDGGDPGSPQNLRSTGATVIK
jgi:hypothetical protein